MAGVVIRHPFGRLVELQLTFSDQAGNLLRDVGHLDLRARILHRLLQGDIAAWARGDDLLDSERLEFLHVFSGKLLESICLPYPEESGAATGFILAHGGELDPCLLEELRACDQAPVELLRNGRCASREEDRLLFTGRGLRYVESLCPPVPRAPRLEPWVS